MSRTILHGIEWGELWETVNIIFFIGRQWRWICHNTVMILINLFQINNFNVKESINKVSTTPLEGSPTPSLEGISTLERIASASPEEGIQCWGLRQTTSSDQRRSTGSEGNMHFE